MLGGGVAGSYLAMLASSRGVETELVEARTPYSKPCGEVMPAEMEARVPADLVKARIRRYRFYVDGRLVEELEYPKARWIVVDKPRMIQVFRDRARERGALVRLGVDRRDSGRGRGDTVIIDARGPYSPIPRRTIMLARMIVGGCRVDPETAELWFSTDKVGFYWVFPADDQGTANIGAGFVGEPHPHIILARFKQSHGALACGRSSRPGAAPLTIEGGALYWRGMLAVGEAGGLVNPLTGEGIRPAMISAEALLESLLKAGGGTYRELAAQLYRDRVAELRRSIGVQRMILRRFLAASPAKRARLLRGLPEWLWHRIYVEGRLGPMDVLRALAGSPRLLAGII